MRNVPDDNSILPMKKSCRHLTLITIGIFCSTFAALPLAEAAMIVVPNFVTATEGGGGNLLPFDIGEDITDVPGQTQRYQQVYNALQFAALDQTGGFITEIRFRPDRSSGEAFSSTLPQIRIDLSTTSAAEGTLSTTFASNTGLDAMIVYGGATGSSLALSSAFNGPVHGPKDFDIVITLTTPFFYNPALGNLLMDVRNFGGGITTTFDSANESDDGTSRILTTSSGVNSAVANSADATGLVTAFTTVLVPEPSGVLMLAGPGLTLLFRRCRQRR